jgi:RNA polymerase sigma-70 factor (ECF subfamily)
MQDPGPIDADAASSQASDRSLVRRLRSGCEDAATQLYLRYARRLQRLAENNVAPDLATRVDPDDIVQSVFRTFFRRANRGEYDVPDGEELWKLLLVMGLNKIRSVGAFHRAARRDIRNSASPDELQFAANSRAGDETSLQILKMAIDEVLGELGASHRLVLEMRVEGHEVAAIAERLGRSKRSVERILQELMKSLSKLITERDES